MINKVTLIGRIGKEPELKKIGEKTLSKFSLATSESYKDKDGNWQEKTQWHQISVWQEVKAEKGDLLYVEGKIEYREHEGKYYTDIIAEKCRKLNATSAPKTETQQAEPKKTEPLSDDLPF